MIQRLFILLLGCTASVATAQILDSEWAVSSPVYGRAPGTQEIPRIAAAERGALVVWTDYRGNGDVYGTRLDENGRTLDPVGIRIATGFAIGDIAAVGRDYMVALSRGCGFIEVVRVTSEGIPSPPRRIGESSPSCATNITIASNGETSLVAWEPGLAALIDGNGTVLASFAFPATAEWTAVASNGEDFLLAGILRNGTVFDVVVAAVSRRGELGNWNRLQAISDVSGLALASNEADYLVVTAGSALRTQVVRPDGAPAAEPKVHLTAPSSLTPSAVWAGGEYLVAFAQFHSLQSSGISIAHISLDGTVTHVSERIETVTQNFRPPNFDLSWSHQLGPFVTWGHDGDVSGARVSDGSTFSESLLSVTARYEARAQIAPTNNGFTVIWREYSPEHGHRLRATALNDDLTARGEILDIAQISPGSTHRVVANASRVVITWTDAYGSGTLYARRFFSDLRPIDMQPVVIATSVREHAVAASQDQALIVWTAPGTPFFNNLYDDVYATAIGTSGPSVPSPRITIAELPLNDHAPAVAWNGAEFLVLWAHALAYPPSQGLYPDPPDDLFAVRVSTAGALLDAAAHSIVRSDVSITSTSAASNGGDYWAAWRTAAGRVLGKRIPANASATPGDAKLLSPTQVDAGGPSVVPAGDRYLLAWGARLSGYLHQIQMRWAFGDSVGALVEFPPREVSYAGGGASVAVKNFRLIIAYDRLAFEPEYGGISRVFVRAASVAHRRRSTRR